MKRSMIAGALGAGMLVFGCSHTTPEEMSAEEHRAEAARHAEAAQEEESKYNPNESPRTPAPPTTAVGSSAIPVDLWTYNPSEYHKYNAQREREHAQEHLRAAEGLERFESQSCEGIPPEQRAACPLLTPFVQTVQEIQRGAILHLKRPDETQPLVARMQCHWAFARTRGFQEKVPCPLYERNVAILAGKEPATIRVEGTTPDAAAHVRRDLRRLFLGTAAGSSGGT